RGLILTGSAPIFARAELTAAGNPFATGGEALWWPPGKIVGRYLAPFLAERAGAILGPAPHESLSVTVDLSTQALGACKRAAWPGERHAHAGLDHRKERQTMSESPNAPGPLRSAKPFDITDVKERLASGTGGYEVVHRSAGLEIGVYVLVAPEPDRQAPHDDD